MEEDIAARMLILTEASVAGRGFVVLHKIRNGFNFPNEEIKMMDEEAIQQIANAVIAQIEPEFESLRADIKKQDEILRKEMHELREHTSRDRDRDRDRMEMLTNQVEGSMALTRGRGPKPVRDVLTGTG